MWPIVLLSACSGKAPPPATHTGATSSHSPPTTDDTGWSCPRWDELDPLPWSEGDDPCETLVDLLFFSDNCSTYLSFHDGWVHHVGKSGFADIVENVEYSCVTNGSVARIRACQMVQYPFEFDLETGLVTLDGGTYHPVAAGFVPNPDTNIGYYMYTYETYEPDFCGYDHTGS